MRAVLVVVCVLILLFVAGWVTFSSGDGDASLNVESERIEQDTSDLAEEGQRVVREVDEKVDVQINE